MAKTPAKTQAVSKSKAPNKSRSRTDAELRDVDLKSVTGGLPGGQVTPLNRGRK
jgi:hypothetical protein